MRCDITHFQADFRPKERHFSSQKFERSGCAWNLLNQKSAKRKISLTHKQLIDDQFRKIFSDMKLKTEQNQTKEKLRTELRKMYFVKKQCPIFVSTFQSIKQRRVILSLNWLLFIVVLSPCILPVSSNYLAPVWRWIREAMAAIFSKTLKRQKVHFLHWKHKNNGPGVRFSKAPKIFGSILGTTIHTISCKQNSF